MIEFEVGARPSKPLSILVRDELDNPVSLLGYTGFVLEIKDTDDEWSDLTGVTVSPMGNVTGGISVFLPKNRTLFPKKGKYLMRLSLLALDGSKDITRTAEIKVRDFGRIN